MTTFAHADATGLLTPEHLLTVGVAVVSLVAYQWATAPRNGAARRARSRRRLWCWRVAIASIVVVQLPPFDGWVEESFAAHMVQHVVLLSVSAPLLVLARPGAAAGAVARAAGWSSSTLHRVRHASSVLCSPAVCWAAVVGYVWAVHFSPVYDLAVRNDAVHLAEHVGFLVAGVLAWVPVLGPRHLALPDPLAVLYVMVLMPALTFCGLTLFSADHTLYSSYADQADPLGDQRVGGMLMWILPGAALLPLVLWLVVRWWRREEREIALVEGAGR